MADELKHLREEIDRIDDGLAQSLNRRAELAKKIGALKANGAAYRPGRETEILRKISEKKGLLSGERLTAVFREIISACRGLEEAISVSYLGPAGTFSEQAVRQHFGQAVAAEPAATIDEAFRSAESASSRRPIMSAYRRRLLSRV